MESALAIGFDYTAVASPRKRRGEPPTCRPLFSKSSGLLDYFP